MVKNFFMSPLGREIKKCALIIGVTCLSVNITGLTIQVFKTVKYILAGDSLTNIWHSAEKGIMLNGILTGITGLSAGALYLVSLAASYCINNRRNDVNAGDIGVILQQDREP